MWQISLRQIAPLTAVCLSNTFPSIVSMLLNIYHILSSNLFVFHEQQRHFTIIFYLFSEIHA